MAGKLILLFKDAELPPETFNHLADLVIFNQHVPVPNSNPPRFIIFEANVEEMERMRWLSEFSNSDILYILDRDYSNRQRLSESSGGLGGAFKIADIVLVQLDNKIHCIKNSDGMRTSLRLAIQSIKTPSDEDVMNGVIEEAQIMRESLLHTFGMSCQDCEFMESPSALDLYIFHKDEPAMLIPMIRYGALREFNKVYADIEHGGVLCLNCANIRDYRAKMLCT